MTSSEPVAAPRLACRPEAPAHLLLPGVRLFDPVLGLDRVADLLVAEGRVAALGDELRPPGGARVVESARGCTVFPGFVDMHTHLRSPGYEYKEDVASASRAAAAGGFVQVTGMANTDPVVDVGPLASWVLDEARQHAVVRVAQVGAVSRGLRGEALAELLELVEAGAIAFSDDGRSIDNGDVLLHALRYLRGTGRPILLHLQDPGLSVDGVMHEGAWSARLGMRGVPSAAESGPLSRDLEVLRYAVSEVAALGSTDFPRLHVQHVSAAASVRLLREAKTLGLPVTAEATPHHLLLTDERVKDFDPNLKINPPLRSEADRLELVAALAEGAIDCVATDHAPHAPHEKEVPFEEAPFGTLGLETAFPALNAGLVEPGHLTLERLIEAMSAGPCRCLGLQAPHLRVGAPADFCLVDLDESWVFTSADLFGKSRNSAFLGERGRGRVLLTMVDGAMRHVAGRVREELEGVQE